ncbi:LacI family DNA-binding transcriptional regulator [Gryllotalpicola protaetiae]|uniref:LacI family transcriptional regulator n=1 Tax=Gryllotalpicola protaetiae TaxID=2419771 RepID=A0A387BK11_9MICO|nr:LacI family DNA-binding transcriptional regulator [Gryllotalpicola protaetiae]AYG02504.1 LacI family transcriptional regulator [Gryllotalpicola protaetiae]
MVSRTGTTTIAEVAKHAGVSPATVSRVMNGRFVGEPAVADRVRASARELSYSPSHLARSLALGRTKAVGFLVPDLANPTFQEILSGFSKAASRDGYRALIADSDESSSEEALLATEIRSRCDAVVLCAPRMPETELVKLAATLQPLVLINRTSRAVSAPSLSIDYQAGIQTLATHLYELGHRHLVFVEGPEESASNSYRVRGLDEFRRAHPDVVLDRIRGGAAFEDGFAMADAVRGTGASAALAFNDLVAVGLINGLAELGVSVPGDISVTGFDDIRFARFFTPTLTTASVPHEELGAEAWLRLNSVISDASRGFDLMFQPRLEVRDSTAPVAA